MTIEITSKSTWILFVGRIISENANVTSNNIQTNS